MVAQQSSIDSLIDTLYESLVDGDQFVRFLDGVATSTNSIGGYVETTLHEPSPRVAGFVGITESARPNAELYAESAVLDNPYIPHLISILSAGSAVYANDIIPHKEIRKTKYYADWLSLWGIEELAGVCIQHDHSATTLAHFACNRRNSYSERERAIFSQIAPHMVRYWKVKQHLGAAEIHSAVLWEMLNAHRHGIVLLNFRGAPIFVNNAAKRIIESNDGIDLKCCGFHIHSKHADEKLSHIIQTMVNAGALASAMPLPEPVIVQRLSGARPYQILLSPIGATADAMISTTPTMVAFIFDPEDPLALSVEQLASLYGMTQTEARLALYIAQGMSIDECAIKLGHQVSTSRNLLKRVFAKTGTHRQHELAVLLIRSAIPLKR